MDCQRLTPEPQDGSSPAYEQDDDMLVGRTMGQFVTLPDGTTLVLNGATNGTAGFANQTLYVPSLAQIPFFQPLASGPVGTPAIYNPTRPRIRAGPSRGSARPALRECITRSRSFCPMHPC